MGADLDPEVTADDALAHAAVGGDGPGLTLVEESVLGPALAATAAAANDVAGAFREEGARPNLGAPQDSNRKSKTQSKTRKLTRRPRSRKRPIRRLHQK